MADVSDVEDIYSCVTRLMRLNRSQVVILRYLKRDFNVQWSRKRLQRYCKRNGIHRHECLSPQDVVEAIMEESKGCAERLGYRMMWERLRRKGILCKRDQVAAGMKLLGLENAPPVKKKKHPHRYVSPGPGNVWHVDGNDKLSQFGFFVHGAIDGYSRKILWLHVFVTNKDPWLIGKFFLETVEQLNGCPCRVQCDKGTENPILAKCQMFIRRNHNDSLAGPRSYFESSSSHINQPIEAFWRQYREGGIQFWIDHFKELKTSGKWNPDDCIHKLALLYVYMPILEEEVFNVMSDWNGHKIRLQKQTDRPNGIPDELFDFPELKGGRRMEKSVSRADIEFLMNKLDLNQRLQYLPDSFKKEGDAFMHKSDVNLNIDTAPRIYEAFVDYLKKEYS